MNTLELSPFNEAKVIALTIVSGCYRRASVNNEPCNYCGYKDMSGRSWVIGDSIADIANPDKHINGKPAIEVFNS